MRKITQVKKFSQTAAVPRNAALWWYLAALAGMLLFCFAPLSERVDTNGLQEHALPDAEPAEAAAAVFLTLGDSGGEVMRLQTQLTALGYDAGDCTGVYTAGTASAVRQFQLDCGFVGDGVCTSAVLYAAAYLSGGGADAHDCNEETVWAALEDAGCFVGGDADDASLTSAERLRNALILFQRTHGLYGSGTADYATLCALGVIRGGDLLGTASVDAAFGNAAFDGTSNGALSDAVLFDLRCDMLCEALAAFVGQYPQAYDLYTLTVCAAVLYGRARDVRFPGGLDTVCRTGLSEGLSVQGAQSPTADGARHDPLLLRAAEDALTAAAMGDDPARGALYVLPADDSLPADAAVCVRTGHFVFYR